MTWPVASGRPRVSAAQLHGALEAVLREHFGTPRSIAMLERRPSVYGSSFSMEELDVRLDDGATLHLMFKDLSRASLLETARRAKPAFLYDPLREIEVYRALTDARLGTAICYGAVVNHRAGCYWLFLERVAGIELYQVGAFEIWQEVARWLARMHDHFAGKITHATHLLTYDEGFYRVWPRRARAFLRACAPRDSQRRGLEWLAARYDRVVERLVALPATLIHGEFYASNVLVQDGGGVRRVCPVDWEMAATGPGLMDLGALTTGWWTEDERRGLAMAYRSALTPRDGWPPPRDAFLAALDCCQLHLAVQWLGWSRHWFPPPQHAQDWLGEALRLAEKLL